jgi:hypothetical protein
VASFGAITARKLTGAMTFIFYKDHVSRLRRSFFCGARPAAFVCDANAAQNAADIFKSEWVGAFPPCTLVAGGQALLYKDDRLHWWNEQEKVRGKHVVELGPMEAAHTWQLLSMGAGSVTAIESNTRSFLKCLVAKEIMELKNARFLCADFVEHLETSERVYDICLASGVLYHMKDPLRLLELICRRARSLFLWTHYYDKEVIRTNRRQRHRFVRTVEVSRHGFSCAAVYRAYGLIAMTAGHLGGSASYSLWLKRDDILAALKHYGMTTIRLLEDNPAHPNGPAITLFARAND